MKEQERVYSPFRFEGFVVQKMKFRRNEKCNEERFPLMFDMDVDYHFTEEEIQRKCCIVLTFVLFKEAENNNFPFELSMTFHGFFSATKSDFDDDVFSKMIKTNGLAILFPYVRSAVCDATKMANVPPVLLPSMNIVEFLKKRKNKTV